MQILHPFPGTVQQYEAELSDPERYRPRHCPQCAASRPLTAHGFYQRTLEDVGFEGVIRVRRYLCASCQRTVSLLPEFTAVSAIQHRSHRAVSGGAFAGRTDAEESRRDADDGLPTRPVLGAAFSPAGRSIVRIARRTDQAHASVWLCRAGDGHAGDNRLDQRSPLPVWAVARALTGLAAPSRSSRLRRHNLAGAGLRLRAPTYLLSFGPRRFDLSCPCGGNTRGR